MASWTLTADEIDDLADGCTLLGSGGGGDTHCFRMVLRELLASRGPVRIIDADALAPDTTVANLGFVGAPIVMTEKLLCENEIVIAVEAMERRLGRSIGAIMAAEIGGGNGLVPLIAASLLDLPVVDADGMGRAFPLSDQITYSIYGHSAAPTVVTTEKGDIVCIESPNNRRIEQMVRALSVVNGNTCFTADYVLSASDVRSCAVLESVSLARHIGGALRAARATHSELVPALANALKSAGLAVACLFDGKVMDSRHETRGGFGFGRVTLSSLPPAAEMTVDFQNEYLVARRNGIAVATTPDIISLVDSETLRNIGSESVRYGQRIKVLAIEAPQLLRSPAALKVIGPSAFGFDVEYRPISACA
ncbi:MAG TPA: DUF917 domain-containing protein [Steroidobacteraceae bacterium]|nr:DUF917 domain-containing protein [Steroidobacteraceae bacterium]